MVGVGVGTKKGGATREWSDQMRYTTTLAVPRWVWPWPRSGRWGWAGFQTCNPCHSCCCYASCFFSLFLPLHFPLKTFLAAIRSGSAKRSHAAHCQEGSQDPAGFQGSISYGQHLQYTGKDFLCSSTSDTAVTTFWLFGRQPVCEFLLKIVVDRGHHPPHILLHHNS